MSFSNHSLTSLTHPISLLRDSGSLCSHLLCMKPSILSCLKIMVRWGYGPESQGGGGQRGEWNLISKRYKRYNFRNTILPSSVWKWYYSNDKNKKKSYLRKIISAWIYKENVTHLWCFVIICRNASTHCYSSKILHLLQSCSRKGPPNLKGIIKSFKGEYFTILRDCHTAYIFKKAMVSLWRSFLQGLLERTNGLVVEGLIEAQFFEVSHLGVRACWSHHLAPFDLADLAHHGAHRPCCSIDQQGLTLLETQDFFYSIQSCQSMKDRERILTWLQFKCLVFLV